MPRREPLRLEGALLSLKMPFYLWCKRGQTFESSPPLFQGPSELAICAAAEVAPVPMKGGVWARVPSPVCATIGTSCYPRQFRGNFTEDVALSRYRLTQLPKECHL